MKKITLFGTGWLMFLTELPLIILLAICIKNNAGVETVFKLYPLIFALIGGIIFIFIYLFRLVNISYEMIWATGRFSSRERALITKDKTLVITMNRRGWLKIEVFGFDEKPPMLDWAIDKDYQNIEVNLFRDRAVGGATSVRRVLKYFNVSEEDITCILEENSFNRSYGSFELSAEKKNEIKEIKIKFTETL